jgi:hypothetical protein
MGAVATIIITTTMKNCIPSHSSQGTPATTTITAHNRRIMETIKVCTTKRARRFQEGCSGRFLTSRKMTATEKIWKETIRLWRLTTSQSNLSISLVGNIIFCNSLDFYLTSSEDFGHSLKAVDSRRVLESLNMQETSSNEEESGETQDNQISSFNEKLVRVICLN